MTNLQITLGGTDMKNFFKSEKARFYLGVMLIICCLSSILVFRHNFNIRISKEIVQAKAKEKSNQSESSLEVYRLRKERLRWINNALSGGNIKDPDTKVSEAEFMVLMFSVYDTNPKTASNAEYWANDYYITASNYGYPVSTGDARDNPVVSTRVAELITAMQGEDLRSEDAVKYLFENNLVSKEYSSIDEFKEKAFFNRSEAVAICKSVVKNGFYQLHSVVQASENKKNLVVLGDSISLGWSLSKAGRPSKYGYPSILGDKATNINVINLSAAGLGASSLVWKVNMPMYKSKIEKADFIIINAGGADLQGAAKDVLVGLRSNQNFNPTGDELIKINNKAREVERAIQNIIEDIRRDTDVPIILYNLYNPIPERVPASRIAEELLQQVNEQIRKIAEDNNQVFYIDSYTAFQGKQSELLLRLDTHPSRKGQEVLAQLALEKLH